MTNNVNGRMCIGEIFGSKQCIDRQLAIFDASIGFLFEIEAAGGSLGATIMSPEPETLQNVQPPLATVPSRLGQSKPPSIGTFKKIFSPNC